MIAEPARMGVPHAGRNGTDERTVPPGDGGDRRPRTPTVPGGPVGRGLRDDLPRLPAVSAGLEDRTPHAL